MGSLNSVSQRLHVLSERKAKHAFGVLARHGRRADQFPSTRAEALHGQPPGLFQTYIEPIQAPQVPIPGGQLECRGWYSPDRAGGRSVRACRRD